MTIIAGSIKARRALFATLGVLCLALGIIGVFVPGLPTTEFVLAASYLFSRSFPTLEKWLERHRWFGPLMRQFRLSGGMRRKAKMLALASTWTGVAFSVYMLAALGVGVQLLLVALGLVGTGTILFLVRTTAARQPLILS
jgi:uncharacterized membrane protein YbaN (DUF454 family)